MTTLQMRAPKAYIIANKGGLDYILQSHQFVLRVRDIFMQSYASKLIK